MRYSDLSPEHRLATGSTAAMTMFIPWANAARVAKGETPRPLDLPGGSTG
jgi:hypothetical protein